MKRILVVQSRTDSKYILREQENFRRVIGESADVTFLSALDERLAWTTPNEFLKGYDGVIFGGSSDFDFDGGRLKSDPARLMSLMILSRARNIITYVFAKDIPLLGICYGHQLIANMYGGQVVNDKEQNKFGAFETVLTGEGKRDRLFSVLPPRFFAQYAHKDSVTVLPLGATLLAGGERCRFSALRYGKKTYTVQFHPEVQHFVQGRESHDSPEASKLIPLWIERIVS
ncbi:MAG: type 1 glutamine amidotransferase [bacterium]|nr:type 1 glutamine amidotransferase [bacterium]